jgi:hypothetical protein
MAGSADTANMKDEGPRHLAGTKRRGSEVIAAPTFEVCNGMDNHRHVKNPKELIQEAKNRRRHDNRLLYYNDIVLEWITNHLLASVIFFDVALIVPLLTLNASDTVKISLGVISSSWIQWHCRRCSAVKTRPKRKMRPKRRLTTRRSLISPNCRTSR